MHSLHLDGEGGRLPRPTCCDWRSFRLMGRPVLVYSRSTTLAAKGPVGADIICSQSRVTSPSMKLGSEPSNMSESYWTVSQGNATRTGHSCRECRKVILKGESVMVRDGRKMRFFYHAGCFSGEADPRTQKSSSFHDRTLRISDKAPPEKGRGKWSTSEVGYRTTV